MAPVCARQGLTRCPGAWGVLVAKMFCTKVAGHMLGLRNCPLPAGVGAAQAQPVSCKPFPAVCCGRFVCTDTCAAHSSATKVMSL